VKIVEHSLQEEAESVLQLLFILLSAQSTDDDLVSSKLSGGGRPRTVSREKGIEY